MTIAANQLQRLISRLTIAAFVGASSLNTVLADPVVTSLAELRVNFAKQLFQLAASSGSVHDDFPQALLRAVVVLRVHLSDENRWVAEVIRENPNQPELTLKALASVKALPVPQNMSEEMVDELRDRGFMEVWLFQTDGRFTLKTLAKPQRGS